MAGGASWQCVRQAADAVQSGGRLDNQYPNYQDKFKPCWSGSARVSAADLFAESEY
jgi:hypothetical protein